MIQRSYKDDKIPKNITVILYAWAYLAKASL